MLAKPVYNWGNLKVSNSSQIKPMFSVIAEAFVHSPLIARQHLQVMPVAGEAISAGFSITLHSNSADGLFFI